MIFSLNTENIHPKQKETKKCMLRRIRDINNIQCMVICNGSIESINTHITSSGKLKGEL